MAAGLSRGIAGLAATTSLWRAIVGLSGGGGLGGGGDEGYTITIPGAVITGGGPGVFNETTGTSGTIATATTDLPDLGSGFQWGIYAGSDARIGVVSTATGQGNTMGITTSSAIYTGDSANFTVTVTNGTLTIGFPFTATGTQYCSEASALFARFSSDPGTTRKNLLNNLIVSLKSAGVWSTLDILYVMAAHDSQAALLNWIGTSYNGTANSSPTFTADRGYTGNGTTSWIDTNFNPTTASAPQYTRNSAHIGVWSRTDVTNSNYFDVSGTLGPNWGLNCRSAAANTMRGYVNTATSANFGSNTTSIGHFVLNRVVSTHDYGYINGSPTATAAATSAASTSNNIALMRSNALYSPRQLAVFHSGAGLDDTKAAALYSAINTYLVAVGAA